MSKLARCCYFHALASAIGFLFLISFGYDCFSPVQAFIESPFSRPCPSRQREFGSAIALSEETNEGEQKSLLEFLSPMSSCKVNQMSGTDLAYVGDAVFELFIRSRHVWPSKRTSDLQNTVVGIVRAEHQSHLLKQLRESFPLSEKENQVLMRGRNAVTKSKNRRNPAAYQDSTAFEALVGYMFITDKDRCQELLLWLESVVDILEKGS